MDEAVGKGAADGVGGDSGELVLDLDDLSPMMFIKKAPHSHGFVNGFSVRGVSRQRSG